MHHRDGSGAIDQLNRPTLMWGVGAVFGPVAGPIVGAMATEAWNWRAAFFIIVPPGIVTLICIWFALKDHTTAAKPKFDWVGFIALSLALVCAQLIFDRGQRLDWFDSREIVLCALIGVLASSSLQRHAGVPRSASDG